MIRSFFTKTWVIVLLAILITVLVCGAIVSFTDNDLAFWEKPLNEKNLLFESYNDIGSVKDPNGITFSNRKGVITISGKIPNSSDAEDSVYSLTKVTLKAGTYTYTCFDNATLNTYYSYLKYTSGGTTHAVYADFDNNSATMPGATVEKSNTFTISEATEVEVVIVVKAGTNFGVGVKAYPTLVDGKVAGEFYAEK